MMEPFPSTRVRNRLSSDILDAMPAFQDWDRESIKRDYLKTATNRLSPESNGAKLRIVLASKTTGTESACRFLADELAIKTNAAKSIPNCSIQQRRRLQDDCNNLLGPKSQRSCRAIYNFHMGLTNNQEMQRLMANKV